MLAKRHLSQHGYDAPHRAQALMLEPGFLRLFFQAQLLPDIAGQALVPLLGGDVLTERGEVERDDADSVLAQPGGGADHEGGLAHLARRKHVAELALPERVVELA